MIWIFVIVMGWEGELHDRIQGWRVEWLDKPMEYISKMGDGLSLSMFNLSACMVGSDKAKKVARVAIWGTVVAEGVVLVMKGIVNRERPFGSTTRWSSGFPSGHTTVLFANIAIWGEHYPEYRKVMVGFGGVVAVSRLYLGMHYLTDVVAGVVIGTVLGKIVDRMLWSE